MITINKRELKEINIDYTEENMDMDGSVMVLDIFGNRLYLAVNIRYRIIKQASAIFFTLIFAFYIIVDYILYVLFL